MRLPVSPRLAAGVSAVPDRSGIAVLSPAARWGAVCVLAALAALGAFAPRFEYAYPLHVDEWTHVAETRQLLEQGPGHTDAVTGHDRGAPHPETGFHLLLAGLHRATGIPLLTIARFLPALLTAVMALGAYVFAERRGFGLEAALFAGFLPTTVRLLGPGFAVLGLIRFDGHVC